MIKQRLFSRKAQAALEFLTTYAWAIIVILITIGALYYFGIFDFGKFLPQECLFTSQFECVDFALVSDEVRFRLLNNIGEQVIIESANVTNDAAIPLLCTSPASFTWDPGQEYDFLFTGCTNGGYISGERASVVISLTYYSPNTPSQPRHQIKGKINAIVS